MRLNLCFPLIAAMLAALAITAPACAGAPAEDKPFLLSMPDLSSPRATIASLLANAETARRELVAYGPAWTPRPAVLRMIATLDIGGFPLPRRTLAAVIAASQLAYVITELPQDRLAGVPDLAAVRQGDIRTWRVAGTPIVIVKVASGPRAGDFLFSAGTEAIAGALYRATKQESSHGAAYLTPIDEWSYAPGPLIPRALIEALPRPLLAPVLGQAVWQWLGLAILLLVSLAATMGIALWGVRHDRGETRALRRYGQLVAPAAIVAIVAATLLFALFGLKVWGDTLAVLMAMLKPVSLINAAWFAIALIRRAGEGIIALRGGGSTSIDSQLIRVVGTLLSIAVVVFASFFIADFIGIPLGPLLAGLGIGGLAVALAIRATLENVIGGLTLFADRPVRVGDFCQVGSESGTVEEIGLRTTKIRRLDDALITIPNAEMAQVRIANAARRRRFLFNPVLGLRYETTGLQLKRIEAGILDMLARDPRVLDEGARVRLTGFGDYALNLEVFAYVDVTRMADFVVVQEALNFLIMEIVSAAGTAFAFPSQTNYLARDTLPAGTGVINDAK
jgi:MscS family membrane protein